MDEEYEKLMEEYYCLILGKDINSTDSCYDKNCLKTPRCEIYTLLREKEDGNNDHYIAVERALKRKALEAIIKDEKNGKRKA